MKRLSIVSTLYNTAAYLPKCLDSLLDQDIPLDEYEIILVDDGSPDKDGAIAQEYASRYPNIRVITQPNKGLAGARNTGLQAAEGKYLRFVDPDDYIAPKSLKSLLEQMERENLDMLRFNYQMVDEQYRPIQKPKDARIIDYSPCIMDGKTFLSKRLGYGCFVWAFIYRREITDGIEFREGDYFDDTAWLPRVLCAASRVDTIDVVGNYYLQREGSLVNTGGVASLREKMNAQMHLIEVLQNQKASVPDKKVVRWYDEMISHCAYSVLSSCAIGDKESLKSMVKKAKSLDSFPLVIGKAPIRKKVKYIVINCSPVICFRIYSYLNLLN